VSAFGRWLPLADAAAPPGPGVLQARRAAGLVDYPSGKSAMTFYGADDRELATALERFRERLGEEERARTLVRFAPPDEHQPPSQALVNLLRQFAARFGTEPIHNRDAAPR
jgi:hypothetical protein